MFQAIVGHEQYTRRVQEKSMPIRKWHIRSVTNMARGGGNTFWKMLKYALQSNKGTFAPGNSHLHGPPIFWAIKGPVETKTISSRCDKYFRLSVSTWSQQTSQMYIIFWEGSQATGLWRFMKIHDESRWLPLDKKSRDEQNAVSKIANNDFKYLIFFNQQQPKEGMEQIYTNLMQ